jgi:uncharacterized protein DUF5681
MAFKPGESGNPAGRPAGVPNKLTADIKAMVLQALEESGGVAYLKAQAENNPVAFMSMLGRILPLQVSGDPEQPLKLEISWAKLAAS